MTTILLVRHGRTAWTDEQRLQGRTDIPLNAAGRDEVRELRAMVQEWTPRSVMVSPALRAVETAQLLNELPSAADARLLEAGLGEWEGRTATEIGEAYRHWRAGTKTPPGGEAPEDVRGRVRAALEDLSLLPGPVLTVTHGGVIRAALEVLLGLPSRSVMPVGAASMTVVEVSAGLTGARLRHYNLGAAALHPAS